MNTESRKDKLDYWKMSNLDVAQKLSVIQPSNWWEMDWYQDKDCHKDCDKKRNPKRNSLAIY